MGEHFLRWGFDPYIMDGEALVTWWTMFDWACWIAYAPLMAIFFAYDILWQNDSSVHDCKLDFTILLRPRMVLRMERYCAQLAADTESGSDRSDSEWHSGIGTLGAA